MTLTLLALAAMAPQTYTNPVYDRDLPDPDIVRDGGAFWMTHTTGGPEVGWPLYRSTDGRNWTFRAHLLDKTNKPAWMRDAFWAPEILKVAKNRYLLTFTSWSPDNGKLSIGMASAKAIEGPYTVSPTPLIAERLDVLDSHLFLDANGSVILYWKRNSENPGDRPGVNGDLRAQRLNASGMRFAPGSKPTIVLRGNAKTVTPSERWEKGLIEAPWVLRHSGMYFLFYSGAFTDLTYGVGVARSKSPFGPFVRSGANPVIGSNATWGGPGHGAFFRDDAGTDFHYYHARRVANPDAGRVQVMDRVVWKGGWPTFAGASPSASARPVPVLR